MKLNEKHIQTLQAINSVVGLATSRKRQRRAMIQVKTAWM